DALESPGPRVAPIAVARRGAAKAVRLPLARHARAVRGLPVAGSGDRAGGGRGDAHTGPADRKRQSGRRATPVPRAAPLRLSPAGGAVSKDPQEVGPKVIRQERARAGGAGASGQGSPTHS